MPSCCCCCCCHRQQQPLQPPQWHYADRGRAGVSESSLKDDHEALHKLMQSREYQDAAEVFRVPVVWPHVMV